MSEYEPEEEQTEAVSVPLPEMPRRSPGRPPNNPRPVEPPPPPVVDEDAQRFEASLSSIMGTIMAAEKQSRDEKKASEAFRLFQETVAQLSDEAFRSLAANGEFQEIAQKVSSRSGTQPGEPTFDGQGRQIGNVPYSYADFERIYPMKTWVPPRDDVIEVNGVSCRVYGHIENTAPSVFYDVQMEAWRNELAALSGNNQRNAMIGSHYAAFDGVELSAGFYKMTDEELIRNQGVER